MPATPEQYESVLSNGRIDAEAVSIVVVTSATVEFAAAALDIDLGRPVEASFEEQDASACALTEIAGGVVAIENTGYADPAVRTLARLSRGGRRAAVARSNIQGDVRFGCAHDGELVFDEDTFNFLGRADLGRVPEQVRALFDLAWVDLDDPDSVPRSEPLAVAMAMCEAVTGLAVTSDDLERARAGGFYRAPSLVYL